MTKVKTDVKIEAGEIWEKGIFNATDIHLITA